MNIQLLKASDFNNKLHEKGCPTAISVQRVCACAGNEKEVREILNRIWEKPKTSEQILEKIAADNRAIYEFEKLLEQN